MSDGVEGSVSGEGIGVVVDAGDEITFEANDEIDSDGADGFGAAGAGFHPAGDHEGIRDANSVVDLNVGRAVESGEVQIEPALQAGFAFKGSDERSGIGFSRTMQFKLIGHEAADMFQHLRAMFIESIHPLSSN